MASCLLVPALRLRLPFSLMLTARALSNTVRSGGPPGSGFTTTITTPDPAHTLPPPGLASVRGPIPPALIYTAAAAAAAAAASGGDGTAKQHSGGASSGYAHHQPMEMGATAQQEDEEELRMEKEEQLEADKTKKAGAAPAEHDGESRHGAEEEGEEDADMNEHARDEAAKRMDYSS